MSTPEDLLHFTRQCSRTVPHPTHDSGPGLPVARCPGIKGKIMKRVQVTVKFRDPAKEDEMVIAAEIGWRDGCFTAHRDPYGWAWPRDVIHSVTAHEYEEG